MISVCLYCWYFVTAHTITCEAVGFVGSMNEEGWLLNELTAMTRGN